MAGIGALKKKQGIDSKEGGRKGARDKEANVVSSPEGMVYCCDE